MSNNIRKNIIINANIKKDLYINNIKKDIIFNAVMDGWKVKKLKEDQIEISKSKNEINEINDVHIILNKLMNNN
jgi:hypothetical protein